MLSEALIHTSQSGAFCSACVALRFGNLVAFQCVVKSQRLVAGLEQLVAGLYEPRDRSIDVNRPGMIFVGRFV